LLSVGASLTISTPRHIGRRIRWGWITAVALGWLLGLNVAAWLGVTGARLGPPDAFDLGEVGYTLQEGTVRPVAAAPRVQPPKKAPATAKPRAAGHKETGEARTRSPKQAQR
jgi:hypothetical protein